MADFIAFLIVLHNILHKGFLMLNWPFSNWDKLTVCHWILSTPIFHHKSDSLTLTQLKNMNSVWPVFVVQFNVNLI